MSDDLHTGRGPDEEDEEDEELGEAAYKTVKDAVLFAIDVSKSMLEPPSDSDPKKPDTLLPPTLAALKCAYALMQQRIISRPNDMMGILLFGTEKSKFEDNDQSSGRVGLQYPHCYLLTDLDVPAAADVKELRDLVQNFDDYGDLLRPSCEDVNMADLLFCANQIFTTKAPNFSSRRMFLVTDNDLPHPLNKDARNSAAVRAKDLYDLGVTIELFPISHPDRGYTFDRSKFYDDIVYSLTPSDPDAPAPVTTDIKPASSSAKDGISLLQSLLSSVASRSAPRRALIGNLPFEIGPGFKISVKAFILLKKQEPKRTSYIYLPPDSDTPQIVTSSSTLLAEDTARSVEKVEIRKAYKFGGETVSFSQEEMAKILNFGDPVLRIIGFKSMNLLPLWASLKPSTFIYPSEEEYVGSTRVFSALHQTLLKNDRFGIAWYIARRNASPVLAAIFPSAEERSEEGDQTMPPGLWLKPLPFADDIRQAPETNLVKAPDTVIDAMRVIVQQLQLPKAVYDPHRYPNPSLQWFYKILQALALEEDLPEQAEDKTLPRWKQIHKRAGGYVFEWGRELDENFEQWQTEHAGSLKPSLYGSTKRSAHESTTENKKMKTAGVSEDITDSVMRAAYEKNAVDKLKVPELKGWLQGKGQGKGISKKTDLVDAVTSYFETRMDLG